MSQAFQDITQFTRFTDLNFEYAFSVIQKWETVFYLMVEIKVIC